MTLSLRTALCLALVAALALTGSAVSPSAPKKIVPSVLDAKRSPIRRPLHYVPSRCYYRRQLCCYRYYPCGYVCRKPVCTVHSFCVLFKNGRCVKKQALRVCRVRCYRKYCLRFHCNPWRITKSKLYRKYKRTRVSKRAVIKVTRSKVAV